MLVERDDGEFLLVREERTEEAIGKYPNMLSIPMGHIEPAEDPPTAALREFTEETGLEAEIDYPLGFFQFEMPNRKRAALWAYKGHLVDGVKEKPAVIWVDEIEFLSLDPFLLRPLNHEIFQLYSVARRLITHIGLGNKTLTRIVQAATPTASHWTPS